MASSAGRSQTHWMVAGLEVAYRRAAPRISSASKSQIEAAHPRLVLDRSPQLIEPHAPQIDDLGVVETFGDDDV